MTTTCLAEQARSAVCRRRAIECVPAEYTLQ